MTDLSSQSCQPCEGGVAPMEQTQAKALLSELHSDWVLAEDAQSIQRIYGFKNFYETMGFVNALAWIAHQQDHHPDLTVSYKQCGVQFSTHSIGGLSNNDFICAAKIDALIS